MAMDFKLNGFKYAERAGDHVLTNRAGGIGSAVARELVGHGHAVVLSGRNERTLAVLAAALLDARPNAAVSVAADTASSPSRISSMGIFTGSGPN